MGQCSSKPEGHSNLPKAKHGNHTTQRSSPQERHHTTDKDSPTPYDNPQKQSHQDRHTKEFKDNRNGQPIPTSLYPEGNNQSEMIDRNNVIQPHDPPHQGIQLLPQNVLNNHERKSGSLMNVVPSVTEANRLSKQQAPQVASVIRNGGLQVDSKPLPKVQEEVQEENKPRRLISQLQRQNDNISIDKEAHMGSSRGSGIGLRKTHSKQNMHMKNNSASRLLAKSRELGQSQDLKSPSVKNNKSSVSCRFREDSLMESIPDETGRGGRDPLQEVRVQSILGGQAR